MTTIGNIMLSAAETDANTKAAAEAAITQAEVKLDKLDASRDNDSTKAQRELARKNLRYLIDANEAVIAECTERLAQHDEDSANQSLKAIEDTKVLITRIKPGKDNKRQRQQYEDAIVAHEKILERLDASKKARAENGRDKREAEPESRT